VIVVCGEALIDLVPVPDAGEDRPVGSPAPPLCFEPRAGGSPFNTAVALARLGTPTSLLARFADDPFGRQLREAAAASGVGLDLAVPASEPTTLAVVHLSPDGAAEYGFYATGTADWGWTDDELPAALPDEVLALHAGSVALARPPGSEALERMLRREADRVTVSVDPNIRPSLVGPPKEMRERLERWVRLAGVVKSSAEDLEWTHPGEGSAELARRWVEAGTPLVVVTDGAAGATAYVAGSEPMFRPAPQTRVADSVGAGDTTTAGLLDWLARAGRLGPQALPRLTGQEAGAALEAALAAAAVTVSRPGADPPWRSELHGPT
jgi:fructokinase